MSDVDRDGRPRPTPDGSARAAAGGGRGADSDGRRWAGHIPATAPLTTPPPAPPPPPATHDAPLDSAVDPAAAVTDGAGGATALPAPYRQPDGTIVVQPAQVVAAAGSAIVTAARVGRLLGRSGWRIARQLPGARAVETEARRLQQSAIVEARRLLQVPPNLPNLPNLPVSLPGRGLSPEEQRAADLIRRGDAGAPLRSAMGELLERSVEATRRDSREYLFGTIISQLTPDEARIVAALSTGGRFAAGDVVLRQRRGGPRLLLANASTIGRQAGLVTPDNTPTYLTRLLGFGLVELGPEDPSLAMQYDILATDPTVHAARESVEPRRRGAVRLVRRTLALSPFGRDFWQAADPSSQTR